MDDTVGLSGAEAAFEDYLRGTDGKRMISVNSDGKITGEYYSVEPRSGYTVELTVDLKLQQAVEDTLAKSVQAKFWHWPPALPMTSPPGERTLRSCGTIPPSP